MSRVSCPCGATIDKVDDGKHQDILGECQECADHKGDYTKSSHWVKAPQPVQQKRDTTMQNAFDKKARG